MQAMMNSIDKYSRLSVENRGIIDQLIDFAFYRDNTQANTTRANEREGKKERKEKS